MRSVADRLRQEDREAALALTPTMRIRLALALGDRGVEIFRRAHQPPLSRAEARRRFERQRQAGRRRSRCIDALIG